MKININAKKATGVYTDPTVWQNSTLRYSPPEDFPAFLSGTIGRAEIMRVWITLDEYWDYRDGSRYPDYDIGVRRYPMEELHYPYDWKSIVPAPSGTRFRGYLCSHAAEADELLLNVRRLEREVSDGVITYDQYEEIFKEAVGYCKELAPNIRYIECGNEVDIKTFGALTAEEYAKIYLCAYKAIKELNAENNYPLPLELGGFAAAQPLRCWEMWSDTLKLLKDAGIGPEPMGFYSYHHYECDCQIKLNEIGHDDVTALSGMGKLRLLMKKHHALLKELGLPEKPVFLNELGKARTTGQAADSLYNAAGLLTYFIAFGAEGLEGLYPFPWCTFHNPKLQISFTQFLLNEDGTYSATPNGIAVMMMHGLHGERLDTRVTEAFWPDSEFCAAAVGNADGIDVIITNPSGETVPCIFEISGLEDGEYTLNAYRVTAALNNCVTGSGDGILHETAQTDKICKNGRLCHRGVLERDNFVLYRITKK